MRKKTLKPITIRDVPDELWKRVKAKAILEGKTTREVVIRLFREYTKERG